MDLRNLIRDVPDFPKPGILFRDITPVLADPKAFSATIDALSAVARLQGPTRVVGIESRGFLFGAPVADRLHLPFALVRKPGKLPFKTHAVSYDLEYGTDSVEIHVDAVERGDRVVVIDDLLATGGTAEAACRLVERMGGIVTGVLVLIELTALGGAQRLSPRHVNAIVKY